VGGDVSMLLQTYRFTIARSIGAENHFALQQISQMFGSMDAVNRFYCMYLRARGQPEKITKMEHDGQIVTT